MAESAKAFAAYVDGMAAAYAPAGTERILMAVANASGVTIKCAKQTAPSLDALVQSVVALAQGKPEGAATK